MRRLLLAALAIAAALCPNATAKIPVGNKIGTLRIPVIGLNTPVFQGSSALLDGTLWPAELKHGPALYPGTSYPCTSGTAALAGHHLTNTHPFRYIGSLHRGLRIVITTRYGSCSYWIVKVITTSDSALWVLDWGTGSGRRLTLTTCDQIYNSAGEQVGLLRTVVLAVGNSRLV